VYDYPDELRALLTWEEIEALRRVQAAEFIEIRHWDHYRTLLADFPFPPSEEVKIVDGEVFSVRGSEQYEERHREQIQALLKALIPWRKGPFCFFGEEIDAEWRSDWKWKRIEPHLPELWGRRIGDIGCNNGYYMLRMLQYDPKVLIGSDPSGRCFYQFDLFRRCIGDPRLLFELFGIEHMHLFPKFFDVLFCLGVLYHRRDPFTSCRMLFEALRPNGTLFMESLVYPGEEPVAFSPPDRYAKMRNVWFIPTVSCLENWLRKAGFSEIEVIDYSLTTVQEQRKTHYAPYDSLEDFLDPNDFSKTCEGHPAPQRAILKATRLQ
jgi:tRNA (mo5U34)-methyltransferase